MAIPTTSRSIVSVGRRSIRSSLPTIFRLPITGRAETKLPLGTTSADHPTGAALSALVALLSVCFAIVEAAPPLLAQDGSQL